MGNVEIQYHADIMIPLPLPNRCNRYLGLTIDSNGLSTGPSSLFPLPQRPASILGRALAQHDRVSHLQTQSRALSLNHRRVYYTNACGSLYLCGRERSWLDLATATAVTLGWLYCLCQI